MSPLAPSVESPNGIFKTIGTCWSLTCSKSQYTIKICSLKKNHMGINYLVRQKKKSTFLACRYIESET